MTIFNFSQADSTLLNAVNANWLGASTSLHVVSGVLRPTAAFGGGACWFSNGQANTQSVQALMKAFTAAGGETSALNVQLNGSQDGYRAQIRQDGDVDFTRNGSFISRYTGIGAFTTDRTLRITYNSSTGVVRVAINGTNIDGSGYTDGSPLTGGFPGFVIFADSNAAQPAIDDWTDLEANAYSLTLDSGSYLLNGSDAIVETSTGSYTATAEAGIYTLTGQNTTLQYSTNLNNYSLAANVGSYLLSGRAASLLWSNAPIALGSVYRRRVGIKISLGF